MEKITFNGKEFKGTNDIFIIYTDSDSYTIIAESHNYLADVLRHSHVSMEEAEANARLFAGSKNLLKAAIEVVKFRHTLPKDQYVSLGELMDNLENAINDCL